MMIATRNDLIEHAALLADESPALLDRLLKGAHDLLERQLGYTLEAAYDDDQSEVPASLRLAVLMLAAHFYENREATLVGINAQPVPYGVAEIIAENRSYTFG